MESGKTDVYILKAVKGFPLRLFCEREKKDAGGICRTSNHRNMCHFLCTGASVKRGWFQRAEADGIFSGRRAYTKYRIFAGGDGAHNGSRSGGGKNAVYGIVGDAGLLLLLYLYVLF